MLRNQSKHTRSLLVTKYDEEQTRGFGREAPYWNHDGAKRLALEAGAAILALLHYRALLNKLARISKQEGFQ